MQTQAVNEDVVAGGYAASLAWIAGLVAIAIVTTSLVKLVFVDFVHGNPHRTRENVIEMLVISPPLFCLLAVIGVTLVFGPSQWFQALAFRALANRFGSKAEFFMLLVWPVAAVITWYSFDYLTPSNFNLGINVGPDWTPYQHGLTIHRYWAAVAAQAPVTLFTVNYVRTAAGGLPRKALIYATLAAAVVAGVIFGHHLALNQYQFL